MTNMQLTIELRKALDEKQEDEDLRILAQNQLTIAQRNVAELSQLVNDLKTRNEQLLVNNNKVKKQMMDAMKLL